ncbi:MAG: DUF2793 domain-containing protein [Rhizobiaceae bacterium]
MDKTPNLDLPYIAPAQAQKHVTHNEALQILDSTVHLSVASRSMASPPSSPEEGQRYIAAASSTDAWAGHDLDVCVWQDGAWTFLVARKGWLVWIDDETLLCVWNGSAWVESSTAESVNPTDLVGVNAIADSYNKLFVKSDSVLHSHDDVTPGSGDARHVINKAQSSNTASLLYQAGWSGRAEIGLAGNDNWQVKVSPDGSNWAQALEVDKSTGFVGLGTSIPSTNLHVEGPARVSSYQISGLPDASATGAGSMIFVTDETGGPVPAFSDGSNWLRVTDRNIVS